MGSWDGAEISELCRIYLLDRLTNEDGPFEKSSVGLYRDDGQKALTEPETKPIARGLKRFSKKRA